MAAHELWGLQPPRSLCHPPALQLRVRVRNPLRPLHLVALRRPRSLVKTPETRHPPRRRPFSASRRRPPERTPSGPVRRPVHRPPSEQSRGPCRSRQQKPALPPTARRRHRRAQPPRRPPTPPSATQNPPDPPSTLPCPCARLWPPPSRYVLVQNEANRSPMDEHSAGTSSATRSLHQRHRPPPVISLRRQAAAHRTWRWRCTRTTPRSSSARCARTPRGISPRSSSIGAPRTAASALWITSTADARAA
jgi:hypothetical protein